MSEKAPGVWSLVLIPAAISLVVSIVRLVGELQGWHPALFGNAGPGEKTMQGMLGISWLILPFGFWFGWKLRRTTNGPPHAGKAALGFAIGAVIVVGGFLGLQAAGLVSMPNADTPGQPSGLGYMFGLLGLSAIVMLTAWPRLAVTLVLYGLLARLPVVAITYIALEKGWDTHYTKLPAGTVLPEGATPFQFLAMPQLTVWIVATLMAGGLMGCLGAAAARRRGK